MKTISPQLTNLDFEDYYDDQTRDINAIFKSIIIVLITAILIVAFITLSAMILLYQ